MTKLVRKVYIHIAIFRVMRVDVHSGQRNFNHAVIAVHEGSSEYAKVGRMRGQTNGYRSEVQLPLLAVELLSV